MPTISIILCIMNDIIKIKLLFFFIQCYTNYNLYFFLIDYINKIRCMDLQTFLQNNLALLQRYIFHPDKKQFLEKQVLLPQDRKLFDYLLNSLSDEQKQLIKQLRLSEYERIKLFNAKVYRDINRVQSQEEKKKIIDRVKQLSTSLFFDFPKPIEVTQKNTKTVALGQSQRFEQQIFETQSTVKQVVVRAITEDPDNFLKLTTYGLKNLPLELISLEKQRQIQYLFQKHEVIRNLGVDEVAKLISDMITKVAQEKRTSQEQEFPLEFFQMLSYQQIQAIKRLKPKLFQTYEYHLQIFKNKYEQKFLKFKQISTLTLNQREQKLKICQEALLQVKNGNKDIYGNLVQKLTEEILLIGQANVNSDIQLFEQYLKNIKSVNYENFESEFKEAKKQQYGRNKYIQKSYPGLSFLDSSRVSQSQIINKTIVSLFKANNQDTLSRLSRFLKHKFLVKQQAKAKLSLGLQSEITGIHDIFTADELNNLKQSKQITFLPTNKRNFKINDKIKLQVRVKNIKKITKKVYTIDRQKQLLQNNSEIDQQINLKFLVPQFQQDINISSQDPFKQSKYQFDFEHLNQKLGDFIVQLEGQGISSRAVVRKGHIFIRKFDRLTGHQIKFFDEQGNVINQLVIWRDSKRIEIKQKYDIPYGPQGSQNIIAVYRGHAEKFNISINRQSYSFDCDYLYHSESFIVGNKAKIILHPTLKLNNTLIQPSRARNFTINISSINNQNISSSQLLQNINFKDNQDYVIQYPIKSYIKNLSIVVEGQIELIDKTIIKLNHSKTINIDLQQNYNNFVDLYLQKNSQGIYLIKVRGKNGQNISKAQVSLSYQQFGINFSFNKDLTTDQNGQVLIGKLLQVTKLTIKVTQNGFASARTWKLNNYSDSISYGSDLLTYNSYKIYLKKGQNFTLPIPCEINLENDVIFQYQSQGFYYNKISSIEVTKQKLVLNNLNIGCYTLYLLRFNRKIDIEVFNGRQWQNDRVIDDNNRVLKANQDLQNSLISLGDIKSQINGDNIEYSIDIITPNNQLPKNLRVHIFAKNYIDSQNSEYLNITNKVSIPRPDIENIEFRKTNYFSNKRLSDETAYVLNRKTQEATNGNNLEKPHIFLKRIQVRSTSERQEELRGEENYKQYENYSRGAPYQKMAYASKNMRMMEDCLFGAPSYSRQYVGSMQASVIAINRNLNSHNNFLYRVGHLSSNLRQINSITVPKGYNQLVVYLYTNNVTIKRQYPLPHSSADRLKLTHPIIKDEDSTKGWTMSREIYQIHKDKKFQINRNSTWTTVSLSNIVQYAKIQGITLPQWITSWKNYTNQKKLEVYDKQISHQLNFYIYRNDHSFFNTVVRPFIKNKLRKTFVDFYLLDDKQQLLKYARAHKLNSLNSFERAILVQKLKQYGKDTEAENLANSLEYPLKNHKKSNQAFKIFFQTVLNAKKEPTSITTTTTAFGGQPFSFQPQRYSAPPPMAAHLAMNHCAMEDQYQNQCYRQEACMDYMAYGDVVQAKQKYKPGFKQTQKTKEYTETTYSGVTNPSLSSSLVPLSQFWGQLARHYSTGAEYDFLSDKFSDFSQKIEYVLASCILSNQSNADYELANLQNGYQIKAKNSFLVFVRQVKSLKFQQSKNIVLNQRFFDPKNRYTVDEEGTQIEKQATNFLIQKPYAVQTLITNISGSNLELQLLMDIPEGSIPLLSHEQTQIINVSLPAYNTKSFERQFYFPEEGQYSFYPANVCKGKSIISKAAQVSALKVTSVEIVSNLQSLDNILRSGSDEDILNFIRTKNIFDQNVFDFNLILWKLKDKQFYLKIIDILKQRQFYHPLVWSFAFYHNHFDYALQFIENGRNELEDETVGLPIFEYYPYYSRRTHKFADQNKSTIRVKQFRENYAKFIFSGIFSNKTTEPYYVLTHIYYLILQDRISEARSLYNSVNQSSRLRFQIQYHYIDCFLDMYEGASTNYKIARQISSKYQNYPVKTWQKLFNDVYQTLNRQGQDDSQDSTKGEQVTFSTTVVNSGTQIKINRPANTSVIVNFYEIDIELYFSQFPFEEISRFSAIKPTKTLTYTGSQFKVQKVDRKQCEGLKNVFVEIYEQKLNTALKKLNSFFWANPEVKVKISEKEGVLKVFHNGKRLASSYCKVYSKGSKGVKFSRDGYTDVASTFRYALDVSNITEFSILVLTDFGGSIHKVKPPSIY